MCVYFTFSRLEVNCCVIETHTAHGLAVSAIDPDGVPIGQVPQARRAVRRRAHEVRRIHREHAVPHPLLVTLEGLLQLKVLQAPQLDGLVAASGCQVLQVRADQALEDVTLVRRQLVEGFEVGDAPSLAQQPPNEAGAVVVRGDREAPVVSHADGPDGRPDLGDELARARPLGELPNPDVPVLVSRHELLLVGVHHDRVHRRTALVLLLEVLRPQVPELHGSVLRTREHQLAVLVETQRGHVPGVSLVRAQGLRVI
mmetsp:Transcript_6429/g.19411  ORF Transcript_6429/g.19411 Transcript_6429/m.19411 type:complete len:256 (+) Transcript_6429:831-1598(+)